MRKLVKDRFLDGKISVSSAGTSSEEEGNGIYPPALRELERNNIPNVSHYAHRITDSEAEDADYIFIMDNENYRNMVRRFPEYKSKIHYLGGSKEIEDPWYSGNFKEVFNQIYAGCENALSMIIKENNL